MIRIGLLVGSGAAVAAPGLLLKVHAAGSDGSSQTKFRPSQVCNELKSALNCGKDPLMA